MVVRRRLVSGNALKMLLAAALTILMLFPMLAYAQSIFGQVIELPPAGIFNIIASPSPTAFTYWYNNMSGGLMYLKPRWYHWDAFNVSNSGYVDFSVWSTSPITLFIFTEQQFEAFNESGSINGYLYSVTGINITGHYYIGSPGTYYVVIWNSGSEPALIVYARALTNSPVLGQWAFPVGIADYGIALINGSILAYSYETNEFVGKVTINNALTQEPDTCPSGSVEPGSNWFSVQLNAVMIVNTTNGQAQYYWLQDVIQFDSLNDEYRFLDNIWNYSSTYSILGNSTITGNGAVYASGNDYYYGYDTVYMSGKLPLTLYLVIKTGLTSGGYPWVAFGYSHDGKVIDWFDNVTINVPATSAYMEVSPTYTNRWTADDAELVVAGPWSGECTLAKSLNINLALYFAWPYPSGEYLSPVPSMWSFGIDTAEAIYNAYPVPTSYSSVNVLNGFEELKFLNTYFMYVISPTIFAPLIITNPLNGTTNIYMYVKGSVIRLSEPEVVTIVPGESRYLFAGYVINNTYVIPNSTLNLRINGPTNIYINYTLQYRLIINDSSGLLSGLSGWYNNGSVIKLAEPLIYNLGNNTRLVFNAYYIYQTGTGLYSVAANNVTSLVINGSYIINVNWIRQYQVTVNSPVPVLISIPSTATYNATSLSTWVNSGVVVSILIPKYYTLDNGTRLVFTGSNESLTVNSPLSINIPVSEFIRQYIVTVISPIPVALSYSGRVINGSFISAWVNGSSVISIIIPRYYIFNNGTRLMYIGNNESMVVNSPLSINLPLSEFTRQYMITVSSPVPVLVSIPGMPLYNTTSLSMWVNSSLTMSVLAPRYYMFNNGTRLIYTGVNRTFTVNEPLSINIPWSSFTRQYMVTVSSPVPITLTVLNAPIASGLTVSTWINSSLTINILVPKYYTFNNDTRLIYMGSNESLTVNSPLSISIPVSEFIRQYFITVDSKYPVIINGTRATGISGWFNEGEVLVVVPVTVFSNGVFMSEPGLIINVDKPQNVAIPWSINYMLTLGMYSIIITIIVITVYIINKRHH